ncbi:unnamed protein product [Cuscuta europaea]|uniref:Uncharacterized protein n=1 Tax=Cuscuta europaea TaxID=41803 RepID=A0A9P1EKK6_CUSEU|nr:unnamed protein product [Cuscuta europaea]
MFALPPSPECPALSALRMSQPKPLLNGLLECWPPKLPPAMTMMSKKTVMISASDSLLNLYPELPPVPQAATSNDDDEQEDRATWISAAEGVPLDTCKGGKFLQQIIGGLGQNWSKGVVALLKLVNRIQFLHESVISAHYSGPNKS